MGDQTMKRVHLLLCVVSLCCVVAVGDEDTKKGSSRMADRWEKLNADYLEELAALRKEYEAKFLALKNEELAEVRRDLEAAMKSLDLERANSLNVQIKRVDSQSAAAQMRTVFLRNMSRGERSYFIRGLNGEWIERSITRRGESTYVYKQAVETPEYVELTFEPGGSVHRLYDNRDMHMDPKNGKKEFVRVSSGKWLYADAAARVAASLPGAAGDEFMGAELREFKAALMAVDWKGNKPGWQEDFRFAAEGRVIRTTGEFLPQRWFVVAPGHVITVNGEIIDSLVIDIDAGTLESRAFSEQTPAAVWRTQRIPAGASP
jgi:hypothetical protein